MICDIDQKGYDVLIEVWEVSVRATHAFLSEKEILKLKPLILEVYFDAVKLYGFKNSQGKIIGFCGIADQKIEMLFVAPSSQGKGVGTILCQHAIENQAVDKVDVNEQNPRAIAFYQKMGFKIISRSKLDAQGNPYPILHMKKEI